MPTPGKRSSWDEKLTRSGLFLAALLFHLVVFLIVAGCVIFKAPPVPPDTSFSGFVQQPPKEVVPKPPTDTASKAPNVDVSGTVSQNVDVIPADPHSPFHVPPVAVGGALTGTIVEPTPPSNPGGDPGLKKAHLEEIKRTVLKYQTLENIQNGDLEATFPVYVASYADGDWACNSRLDAQGNIIGGSMPDLAAKIAEWSHGHVKAQVVPKPLNIGGRELLDTMPPFIFFTGHKDFVLTEPEVSNLRDYLQRGGAIWGDNALPGKGSRFDVAFRREMKRVVGDKTEFEPMTLDADIFTKSQFAITALPAGMNYYSEPLEHIDLDGKLAILYTPNDYSDLFFLRILPGDTTIGPTYNDRTSTSPLITSGTFYGNRTTFFRNFTLPSAIAVHRLGMNIVVHLLTRFNDELQLTP